MDNTIKITCVALLIGFLLLNKYLNILREKNVIDRDRLIKDIPTDNNILEIIESIIENTLDEYRVLILAPKQVIYINNKQQDEIMEYMSDEVPKRISTIAMKKLEYIYNKDYIGSYIGTTIYMHVLNFVIDYNVNNHGNPETKK